ncbi:hypothetical protein [Flavobacterium hibisci]|uniref:hypothetical protein n=1 Tax=Flavobacterium hibisci TaxID=1914462 RepID=UPI001CBE3D94|nr:hypothetical protein [Flavobacterium hibisci]MBZ4043216.1 hypothetical protein [Flavobacterium hibisci]
MKKQKIEDIFSSIENFSSVPPPELWNKIEEELDKPKKKKRAILWWSAAACLLLGLLLPTISNFNSNSGIEKINNGATEKSVVIDENNNNLNNQTRSIEKNNIEIKPAIIENPSVENGENPLNNAPITNTHRTSITHIDTKKKINSGITKQNPNIDTENLNKAVAEKTYLGGKQNSFNSLSNNSIPTEKTNENQYIADKTFDAEKQHSSSSLSNNSIPTKKTNINQNIAEKTFSPEKQHSPSSLLNNSIPTEKANMNQTVAEETSAPGKQNSFSSFSNNEIPNSVLEDKASSINNTGVALNASNVTSKNTQKDTDHTTTAANKSIIADNFQKNSSISANSLSSKDSVQLAELQNLEKGIAEVKTEKEKDINNVNDSEKWSLDVFAGIANSENYNNQKTLGNVNESKQTNSYGVKANYKLNKKWAVSSGLKINELGQSIANVSYYNHYETSAYPLTNSYSYDSPSVIAPQITSNSNYVFVSKNTQAALKSDNLETGNMDQSLKYIEMPLEVSYSILNKNKTNISLNTGGFVGKLISNNVTLNGNSIGGNLNANDFIYGSLLSSTFQYQLYKKTHVFVEPGMNYYINPLNNQTFNQFQWSFNFGLNVSF